MFIREPRSGRQVWADPQDEQLRKATDVSEGAEMTRPIWSMLALFGIILSVMVLGVAVVDIHKLRVPTFLVILAVPASIALLTLAWLLPRNSRKMRVAEQLFAQANADGRLLFVGSQQYDVLDSVLYVAFGHSVKWLMRQDESKGYRPLLLEYICKVRALKESELGKVPAELHTGMVRNTLPLLDYFGGVYRRVNDLPGHTLDNLALLQTLRQD